MGVYIHVFTQIHMCVYISMCVYTHTYLSRIGSMIRYNYGSTILNRGCRSQ